MKFIAYIIIGLGTIASLVIIILKRIWSKEAQDRKTVEKTDMSDPSSVTSTLTKINRCLIIGLLIFLSGCSKSVVLYPIEQTDIVRVEKGKSYEAPKDGYFLSDFYIKEVMQAKIED